MAGSLFGELLGLSCLCLSSVFCIAIDGMWLGGGVPNQPTPEPYALPEPSELGPGAAPGTPCISSCRSRPEQDLQPRPLGHCMCTQLTCHQELGRLSTQCVGGNAARRSHWLRVCPSCVVLLYPARLLVAPFPQITEKWTLAGAARAVLFVPTGVVTTGVVN